VQLEDGCEARGRIRGVGLVVRAGK
jgi:hypothetical protein